MPPRRYPETDRPASEASGWPEGSPLGIAAAPAIFFLKRGKLGYHREASWIESTFLLVSGLPRDKASPSWRGFVRFGPTPS